MSISVFVHQKLVFSK